MLCSYDEALPVEQATLAQEFVSRAAIALENAVLFSTILEGDRRKNEFLAMLAHEPRNPLAPIANAYPGAKRVRHTCRGQFDDALQCHVDFKRAR